MEGGELARARRLVDHPHERVHGLHIRVVEVLGERNGQVEDGEVGGVGAGEEGWGATEAGGGRFGLVFLRLVEERIEVCSLGGFSQQHQCCHAFLLSYPYPSHRQTQQQQQHTGPTKKQQVK